MQRDQKPSALSVILGTGRVAREREIDDLERLAEVAVLGRDHREQEQRGRLRRIRRENPEAELVSALEVAPIERTLGVALPGDEVGGRRARAHAPES